jgi:hypothetical protein
LTVQQKKIYNQGMQAISPQLLEIGLANLWTGDISPLESLLCWMKQQPGICGLLGRLATHQESFQPEEVQRGQEIISQLLNSLQAIPRQERAQRTQALMEWAKQWATLTMRTLPPKIGRPRKCNYLDLAAQVQALQREAGLTKSQAVAQVAESQHITEQTVWRALRKMRKVEVLASDEPINEPEMAQLAQTIPKRPPHQSHPSNASQST